MKKSVLFFSILFVRCGLPESSLEPICSSFFSSENRSCLIVGTSDFSTTGGISVVDTHSGCVWQYVTTTWQDALVFAEGEEVYVVNREGGDNIQRLDPSLGFQTSWQRSVGNGSNPQGIAVFGETGFVPLYNENAIAVVDLHSENFVIARIDLPLENEVDGRAEPSFIWIVDETLYVLVDGLNSYPNCAGGHGRLYGFDVFSYEPKNVFDEESVLELAFCNPGSWDWLDEERIIVGSPGNFRVFEEESENDGGLEVLNLRSGRSEGVILSEVDFGERDLLDLAVGEQGRLWITLTRNFESSVHLVRLYGADADRIGEAVWTGEGIFDIAEVNGILWIADRKRGNSGLVPINAETSEVLSEPISMGLPPFSISSIDDDCHFDTLP